MIAPEAAADWAPAKINLYLHVTGRRADGYHLLESAILFADIGDRLSATPADGFTLSIVGPQAGALDGAPHDNLVLRAARALAEQIGWPGGLAFTLDKHLPVAAGIGGGSSDAAAALRLVARFCGTEVSEADMAAVGARLGADIPVCVGARPTRVGGVGEILTPITVAPLPMLLVNPGQPLSTAAVFRALRQVDGAPDPLVDWPDDRGALIDALAARRNDLEPPAIAQLPVIGTILDALAAMPGCRLARMSGSGPTCFGLFDDDAATGAAAETMARAHPDWWVMPSRSITGLDTSPSRARAPAGSR